MIASAAPRMLNVPGLADSLLMSDPARAHGLTPKSKSGDDWPTQARCAQSHQFFYALHLSVDFLGG